MNPYPNAELPKIQVSELTALGNRAEAENYLNRAAMLMPRDLRVAEALKALR